jgi:MtN3 and saliva related transmembrane protein
MCPECRVTHQPEWAIDVAMNYEWIGYAAAALTTSSFLPQALMTIRTRRTGGISLAMYTIFTLGTLFWLIYGVLVNSWPMILANSVTFALALTILVLKLRYR